MLRATYVHTFTHGYGRAGIYPGRIYNYVFKVLPLFFLCVFIVIKFAFPILLSYSYSHADPRLFRGRAAMRNDVITCSCSLRANVSPSPNLYKVQCLQ